MPAEPAQCGASAQGLACVMTEVMMQANRGGDASTSGSAPVWGARPRPHLRNGAQSQGAGTGTRTEEDPAWLALPAVHYALMQGNQQPSFRLATGQHDTRHWLAWEVCTQAD